MSGILRRAKAPGCRFARSGHRTDKGATPAPHQGRRPPSEPCRTLVGPIPRALSGESVAMEYRRAAPLEWTWQCIDRSPGFDGELPSERAVPTASDPGFSHIHAPAGGNQPGGGPPGDEPQVPEGSFHGKLPSRSARVSLARPSTVFRSAARKGFVSASSMPAERRCSSWSLVASAVNAMI